MLEKHKETLKEKHNRVEKGRKVEVKTKEKNYE